MLLKYKLLFYFFLFFTITKAQNNFHATIKIDKNIYIDQTEVDVASWLSYYSWVLEHEGKEVAKKILPDSCCIIPEIWSYIKNGKSDIKSDFIAKNSFQSIGYYKKICEEIITNDVRKIEQAEDPSSCVLLYYPITGVSYEQVVNFCKWRTKVEGNGKYIFRLMTEEEWKKYALSGLSKTEQENRQKDTLCLKHPAYCYKTQLKGVGAFKNICLGQLVSPASYPHDKNYIYDLFGNVSEMVFQKGIAKGGSYANFASQSYNVDSVQHYSKQEKWLGFRCIAIKLNKKNEQKLLKENAYTPIQPRVPSKYTMDGKYGKIIDNRDGNTYSLIKIGNNIWFSNNLAFKPEVGKYWTAYNDTKNVDKFGYLYSWEVAQNVCPDGWGLPTNDDFSQLIDSYGDSAYVELRPNGNSGFSAYNCPLYYGSGFTPIETGVVFWTSTEINERKACAIGFSPRLSVVKVYDTYPKKHGFPVRCIKHD